MTYRYVENPPTHCATLLGDKFGKEIIYQIIKKKRKKKCLKLAGIYLWLKMFPNLEYKYNVYVQSQYCFLRFEIWKNIKKKTCVFSTLRELVLSRTSDN